VPDARASVCDVKKNTSAGRSNTRAARRRDKKSELVGMRANVVMPRWCK